MAATARRRKLTTLDETSAQLGVEVKTLRSWRWKRRHLDFAKVGGKIMVTQESIDRLIERGTMPALDDSEAQP